MILKSSLAARVAVAMVLLACLGNWAHAHKPSDSYLNILDVGGQLRIEWDIALKDLEFLVGLDSNFDGDITWGELKEKEPAVVAHALSRLKLSANGQPLKLNVQRMLVSEHSDGSYAVLQFEIDCPDAVKEVGVEYSLLFDQDPTHRGLVLFQSDAGSMTGVLSPSEPVVRLEAGEMIVLRTLWAYIREGIWHIWIGFDHILFLVSLLLPSVWARKNDVWQSVEQFKPACLAALKIVTVFTIAHSITLWLAIMEYVTLPGQIVESTIAFSIVVTAINNLYPVLGLSNWAIAFVFGLIHGFGFANVLLDLGLSSVALAVSLLGFNLGVELGQVVIVLIFLPVAYLLRRTAFYRIAIFRAGSVTIAIIASIWMYERLCNVEILGF